ncbi:MAG: hypothetical protein HY645_05940 [Acidobacteria bacterium]|nr:hypothetical protein [Acidobacteriota bacterium]
MNSRILAGAVAGLIAGVIFGVMMQMMSAPTPMGEKPMIVMVANILGSESAAVGWLYHLFNSALIGGLFGWIFALRVHAYMGAIVWGAVYGFFWWILGGLILMPIFLGNAPLAPLMMAPMRPVAMGSLMGHLIYGVVLAASFVAIWHHEAPPSPATTPR